METITIQPDEVSWQHIAYVEICGQGEVKVFRDERPSGVKTILVRLRPGNRMKPPPSAVAVQHFLVAGEYASGGDVYHVGSYRQFPACAEIPMISTVYGATILMVYDGRLIG